MHFLCHYFTYRIFVLVIAHVVLCVRVCTKLVCVGIAIATDVMINPFGLCCCSLHVIYAFDYYYRVLFHFTAANADDDVCLLLRLKSHSVI